MLFKNPKRIALAAILASTLSVSAYAQDGTDDDEPVLPPTVVEAPEEVEAPAPPPPPPFTPPPAPDPFAGTIFDSPFDVTPSTGQGYRVDDATSGAGFALPQLDFPGVVNVVPRDLIDDQLSFSAQDALRNAPNVVTSDNAGGRVDSFFLRGFQAGFNDFRKDGFRDTARVQRDVANLDRIEVLKGPAAILYGSGAQPGGTINFITKKPLSESLTNYRFVGGEFDFFRHELDVNRSLTEDGLILGRVNVAYQDSESFRNFAEIERFFVAPALSFVLTDYTLLTIQGEYLNDERRLDRGIPAVNGDPFAVPIENYLGEPTDGSEFNDGQINAILDHRFANDWALRLGWVSNMTQETGGSTEPTGLDTSGGAVFGDITRTLNPDRDFENEDHFFLGKLSGEVDILGFNHRMLLGMEIGRQDSVTDAGIIATTNSINALNPVYGNNPNNGALSDTVFETELLQQGFFIQDVIDITPRLSALAGVRYDRFDRRESSDILFDFTGTGLGPLLPVVVPDQRTEESSWNPRFGLVYQPVIDDLSFYGSYSTSFFLPAGAAFTGANLGNPFDPANFGPLGAESGRSVDYGIKANLTDELSLLVGGFFIERENITLTDTIPGLPVNLFFFRQVGKARSQGIEVELLGRLTEYWSIIGGYGYTDTEILEDLDPAAVGQRLPEVPRNTVNVFSRCDLYQTDQTNVGVGLGCFYIDEREIGVPSTLTIPSYVRWDAAAYASYGCIDATLYVENLFDEGYIIGGGNEIRLFPGAPTTVRAAVQTRF